MQAMRNIIVMVQTCLATGSLLIGLALPAAAQEASYTKMAIFPPQELHVHGSSIVELPNGDLLAGWFQGTGERSSDDVRIMGARLIKGKDRWTEPFLLADTPEFPDFTPIFIIDGKSRLWMIWYVVLANQWETSLLKYRTSSDYMKSEGAPTWEWQDVLHMKPGGESAQGIQLDDSFANTVERKLTEYVAYLKSSGSLSDDPAAVARVEANIQRIIGKARGTDMIRQGRITHADGKVEDAQLGFPYFRRMGWQTRNKPVILDGQRMIVPLYSDGFSFSIMAITDDWGATWQYSEPLVGFGNIQPSIARKRDGSLIAYMRDNGAAPKRLHVSESRDRGMTWGPVHDSELPNPGSGADIVTLANGNWLLVYNDAEDGRYSLAVSLSPDEGKTWPYTRHLERDLSDANRSSSHYPAVIQGLDGTIHITYSHHATRPGTELNAPPIGARTINYVRFDEAWVKQGD